MLSETEQHHHWGKLPAKPYTALGLDIGSYKIGAACGQSMLGTATPEGTIKSTNGRPDWGQLEALLKKWKPQLVVIGWPLNMDGSPTFLTPICERVANKIHGRYKLAVRCIDERLSTREAYDIAHNAAAANWKNKAVDALAAAVILEDWFKQTPP